MNIYTAPSDFDANPSPEDAEVVMLECAVCKHQEPFAPSELEGEDMQPPHYCSLMCEQLGEAGVPGDLCTRCGAAGPHYCDGGGDASRDS